MPALDPRFSGLAQQQGLIPNVDWRSALMPQGPQQVNQFGQTPDIAAQNQTSMAQQAAMAGVQNQKDEEAVDALAEQKYKLPAEKAKLARQFKTANAIRNLGSSLNTGSTGGAAPNWAGAIANVVGAYQGRKQDEAADAAAAALGGREADLASLYFRQRPTSYF